VYGEEPVVTVEAVRVDVSPCVTVPTEGVAEGVASAVLTVIDGAVDCADVVPRLSVTVAVIEGVPIALGV
jgi:hypothetical protein